MIHKTILNLLKPHIRATTYIWPAIITGGATLLGGILANKQRQDIANNTNQLTTDQFNRGLDFNREQSQITRDFNQGMMFEQMGFNSEEALAQRQWSAEQAQINRDWMTKMSNTQHQRQVSDLKKAGLNPILSANSGAGVPASPSASGMAATAQAAQSAMATAPSSGQFQQAQYQDPIGNAINTGMDLFTKEQDVNESKARVRQINTGLEKIRAETKLTKQQFVNAAADLTRIYHEGSRAGHLAYGEQLNINRKEIIDQFIQNSPSAAIMKDMGMHNAAIGSIASKILNLYEEYNFSEILEQLDSGMRNGLQTLDEKYRN